MGLSPVRFCEPSHTLTHGAEVIRFGHKERPHVLCAGSSAGKAGEQPGGRASSESIARGITSAIFTAPLSPQRHARLNFSLRLTQLLT